MHTPLRVGIPALPHKYTHIHSVLQCVAVCCSVRHTQTCTYLHALVYPHFPKRPFNEPYAPSLSTIYDGA